MNAVDRREPEILWRPPADVLDTTVVGRFVTWLGDHRGVHVRDYDELWSWSTRDLESFWQAVIDFFAVSMSAPPDSVLLSRAMPGAHWLAGARLNYAEHALRMGVDRGDDVAVIAASQTRGDVTLTWIELTAQVARARAGLARLGVGRGDCVAAYLPNIPETVVAFLAAASLGAVWSSCAPEFGVAAVLDRFRQIEPKVLLVVDGYRYGARDVDVSGNVDAIAAGLPTVAAIVGVPYADAMPRVRHDLTWQELLADDATRTMFGPLPFELLTFEQVPAEHPLYVLYSSGTTGLPKAIVHGHGGIILEHLKMLGLHGDLGPSDRFFWFTTTGWMMWNYLVSGLLVGATIVMFDGDPGWPDLNALWEVAARHRVAWFGASAPFIMSCRRAGLVPRATHDLGAVRAVGSTGAPLPADGFRWVYESVGDNVLLSSISGGTDVCSAFVGSCPLVPVWAGEISCRALGAAVAAFDERGQPVVGVEGELVITEPMPSMPVGFWGDTTGEKLKAAYFDYYPGVWRHGDWVTFTERGSCVISGRSDATLNRAGVRIGTAEIYRIVESVPGVTDSLIVHLDDDRDGGPGQLVLLVQAEAGEPAEAVFAAVRAALRRELSPRHVPDEIYAVPTIPTTLSGKKLELPVKAILAGGDPARAASRDSLRDPSALDAVVELAARRRHIIEHGVRSARAVD